jgi:hypothetical protein
MVGQMSAYIGLYQIPLASRVLAASIHMPGATTHWFKSYKLTTRYQHWDQFTLVVVSEFEVDTHWVQDDGIVESEIDMPR